MLVLSIMTRVAVMGQMGGQTGAGGAGLTGAGGAGGGGFEGQLENVRCPPLRCSLPVSPAPVGCPAAHCQQSRAPTLEGLGLVQVENACMEMGRDGFCCRMHVYGVPEPQPMNNIQFHHFACQPETPCTLRKWPTPQC